MIYQSIFVSFSLWGFFLVLEQFRRHNLALRVNAQKQNTLAASSNSAVCFQLSFRTVLDLILSFALVVFIVQLGLSISCLDCGEPTALEKFAQWTSLALCTTCKAFVCLRWRRLAALARDMRKVKSKLYIGKYKWQLLFVCLLQLAAAGCIQFGTKEVQLVGLVLLFVCGCGATLCSTYFARYLASVVVCATKTAVVIPRLLGPALCTPSTQQQAPEAKVAGRNQRGQIFEKLLGMMQQVLLIWGCADVLWLMSMWLFLDVERQVEIAMRSLLACAFLLEMTGTIICLWTPGPLHGDAWWQAIADASCGPCFSVLQCCVQNCNSRGSSSMDGNHSSFSTSPARKRQVRRLTQVGLPARQGQGKSLSLADESKGDALALPQRSAELKMHVPRIESSRKPVASVSIAGLGVLMTGARAAHLAAVKPAAQLSRVDGNNARTFDAKMPHLCVQDDDHSHTIQIINPLTPMQTPINETHSIWRTNAEQEALPPLTLPLPQTHGKEPSAQTRPASRRSISFSFSRPTAKSQVGRRLWLAAKSTKVRSRAKTEGIQGLDMGDIVLDAMFWTLSCDVNGIMDSPDQLFAGGGNDDSGSDDST